MAAYTDAQITKAMNAGLKAFQLERLCYALRDDASLRGLDCDKYASSKSARITYIVDYCARAKAMNLLVAALQAEFPHLLDGVQTAPPAPEGGFAFHNYVVTNQNNVVGTQNNVGGNQLNAGRDIISTPKKRVSTSRKRKTAKSASSRKPARPSTKRFDLLTFGVAGAIIGALLGIIIGGSIMGAAVGLLVGSAVGIGLYWLGARQMGF